MKKLIVLLAIFVCLTADVKSQLIYYHWNPVYSPVSVNLNSIYLSNSLLAAGNSGTVLYSSNAGTNWVVSNPVSGINLSSIYGTSTTFIAGASGTIIKSTNYGLNWSNVVSPTTNSINSVNTYVTQNYRIIVCDGGKIYTSTNLGTNWNEVTSGTTNSLRYVNFSSSVSPFRGYVCGDNGTFIKLVYALPVPPSITVLPYSTGVTNNFYGVAALGDTSNIMLVGSGGKIMKSTNSGVNWTSQTSGTTNTLRFINVISANDIWAGGDNGTILHTTNGGVNWFAQYVGSTASVNSMLFLSGVKAIAVGSGGTILECNFPNPLTDTTIKRVKLDGNNLKCIFPDNRNIQPEYNFRKHSRI